MFKFRWKQAGADPLVLQWMCPFNIQVLGNGPRAGELVIVPAPPGKVINWIDVPVEAVIKGDKEDFALQMPDVNKVIAPASARVPAPGPVPPPRPTQPEVG